MPLISLYVISIIFISTIIRSSFGFGEALFAVPLLALYIPLKVATPLAVLVSITIAGVIVIQDWQHIHIRSAAYLILPTLFGIPIGLLILTSRYEDLVKATLALLLISFAAYSLIGRAPPQLQRDNLGWLLSCGFCAGVLGGAYGMNGPPLVIYGTVRRWPPQHLRATLQGYFLPASIIAMFGYWLTGLWSQTIIHYYLLSLLGVVPAVFIGRGINRRLSSSKFLTYIYISLAGIGVILLAQALHTRF